jgi:hypothetical protein
MVYVLTQREEEERKIREEDEGKSGFLKIDAYVFLITSLCKHMFLVLVPILNPVGNYCHISMCHVSVC